MHLFRIGHRSINPVTQNLAHQPAIIRRTPFASMATSPSTTPGLDKTNTTEPTTLGPQDPGTSSTLASKPLPLPAPHDNSTPTQLDVSGDGTTVKLDYLGPVVVNQDGSLGRISNWDQMSDIERKNTVRVLGKRHAARLATLRSQEEGEAA
jgi:hypothetical protein